MELDMTTVGNRIKKRRKALHLTQMEIKEKTGISSGNMSEIEQGNRLPAAATLVLLSEILECSIDYLLTGKTPEQENLKKLLNEPVTEEDISFLRLLHGMSKEDKEELLLIAELKYQRRKNLL